VPLEVQRGISSVFFINKKRKCIMYQYVRQIQNYKSNASNLFIFIFVNDFILDKYKLFFK